MVKGMFSDTSHHDHTHSPLTRPEKLYSTDDEVLRHAQIMPDEKKKQSFKFFFYFSSDFSSSHDCKKCKTKIIVHGLT